MLRLAAAVVFAVLAIVCATLLGQGAVSLADIVGRDSDLFWTLRAPRVLKGALAGAGLSIAGVILQALFRNPLVTPYTLGVSGGAAVGAACASLLGWTLTIAGVSGHILAALVGALLALLIVMGVGYSRQSRDLTRLLLAGVSIAYLSAAGVLLVNYFASPTVTNDIVIWLMGALDEVRPRANLEMGVMLALVIGWAVYCHRPLDLLALGPDIAATRGVATGAVIWISFAGVGVLTAVIVANCGPLGFVGLIIPHIARSLIGVRTGPLLIGSALIGAGFLALCDGLARVAIPWIFGDAAGYEIPVGVITNILGAVFFLFLLVRRKHLVIQ